jgi:hypothetical protein
VRTALQAAPAAREGGRRSRSESSGPRHGAISRRVIGKAIGAAAVGVVGAGALVELRSQQAQGSAQEGPGTSDSLTEEADVTAAEATADNFAAAASSASVINATLSSSAAVVAGANSSTGPGVQGSSKSGRGGVFSGALAQVHLTPGGSSTHPRTGQAGDLYVDKTGRLWFCLKTGSRTGWKQIG